MKAKSYLSTASPLPMFSNFQPLFLQKVSLYIHIPNIYLASPIFIWDWNLNLGRKELGFSLHVSIVCGPIYNFFLSRPFAVVFNFQCSCKCLVQQFYQNLYHFLTMSFLD